MTNGKILIAGGGIGGLAAAACLLKAGIDVDIYEQAPELAEVGAGIQMSANPTRVLYDLSLQEEMDTLGYRPETYRFVIYSTSEVLQQIQMGDAYVKKHGVPYYVIHRADFLKILEDKVRALKPDCIHLNSTVTGFRESATGVELHLADGSKIEGDALIGADGIKSPIRSQIVGEQPAHYTGDIAWRIIVPMSSLTKEDEISTVDIWPGPGRHAVTYPIRSGKMMNFVGVVAYQGLSEESWTAKRPWSELKADFDGWHPRITRIIDAADKDQCFRWALNNRKPVEGWSTDRATLLGDAAHPTLPYMAQGAAMAIEDAAVLCRTIQSESSVSAAFDLYQRNRYERTAKIVNESSANRGLFRRNSPEELKEAFAARGDISAERTAWLFSYDPITVELT
jgi:salicylate hydroxylase